MNFQGFVELIVAAIDDVQNLKKTEALLAAIVEQNPEFFYTSAIQCLKIPNFDAKVFFPSSSSRKKFIMKQFPV